ncbi:MAG: hypothetical protein HQL41_05655 [Alphaproteobacteria bacterium]|nr:hypothetical protein [Alphaproteobacteria bacterium]
MPAKAGIHSGDKDHDRLDARFRGHDDQWHDRRILAAEDGNVTKRKGGVASRRL